jgi:hypothetical protein
LLLLVYIHLLLLADQQLLWSSILLLLLLLLLCCVLQGVKLHVLLLKSRPNISRRCSCCCCCTPSSLSSFYMILLWFLFTPRGLATSIFMLLLLHLGWSAPLTLAATHWKDSCRWHPHCIICCCRIISVFLICRFTIAGCGVRRFSHSCCATLVLTLLCCCRAAVCGVAAAAPSFKRQRELADEAADALMPVLANKPG